LCGCTVINLNGESAALASGEAAVWREVRCNLNKEFAEDACAL
jgi:hypothetical protein